MNPMNVLRDMRTIRQLLTDAERTARQMGDEQPAAEHLLLAAMDLPDGTASRILGRFGVDRDAMRAAIEFVHTDALDAAGIGVTGARGVPGGRPLPPVDHAPVYRSSASAQEAFQAAGAIARASRERLAGTHVVAAIAAMEHGTSARMLERLGIDRVALAAAADEQRERSGG